MHILAERHRDVSRILIGARDQTMTILGVHNVGSKSEQL